MALQGTIETFPIIDVLHLLSAAGHTGRLTVEGDGGHVELWVADRVLRGGRVDGCEQVEAASLVTRVLRHRAGVFLFENVALPDALGSVMTPTPLDEAVVAAQERLEVWRSVESVVPSTAHRLRLSSALTVPEVTLDRTQWALVVAASRWPSLAEAAAELGMDDLTAGRMAVEMVAGGLLVVEEPLDGPSEWSSVAASATDGLVVDTQVVAETVVVSDVEPLGARLDEALGVALDLTATDPISPVDLQSSVVEPGPGPTSPPDVAEEPQPGPVTPTPEPTAPPAQAFPDRFPIDDLLGGGADDEWGVIGDPLPPVTVDPFADAREAEPTAPAAPVEQRPVEPTPAPAVDAATTMTFAGLPDDGASVSGAVPVDEAELRRQMAHLSPKAAEAVAAALEQMSDPRSL